MPPAEFSFHRRLESGDVLPIGQALAQRHAAANNMLPRHHPYARKGRFPGDIPPGSPTGSNLRGVGRGARGGGGASGPWRHMHAGGAMSVPGSPDLFEHRAQMFGSDGPSYFSLENDGFRAPDQHPRSRIAPRSFQQHPEDRLDNNLSTYATAQQHVSRIMLGHLDRAVDAIRRDLMGVGEEGECEM
jgi:hypothetical protein